MSTEHWHAGKLPGRVEFPDGWVAHVEPGTPWGSFLAEGPDGRTYMFDLPKSGDMYTSKEIMDDEDQPTGFYVWIRQSDPYLTIRIGRQYWD